MSLYDPAALQVFAAYIPNDQRICVADAKGVEIGSFLAISDYATRIVKESTVENIDGEQMPPIDVKLLNDGTVIAVEKYLGEYGNPVTSIRAFDPEKKFLVVSNSSSGGHLDKRSYIYAALFEPASGTAIGVLYLEQDSHLENSTGQKARTRDPFVNITARDKIRDKYKTDKILEIYNRKAKAERDLTEDILKMSRRGKNYDIPSEALEPLLANMTGEERDDLGFKGDILFRVRGDIRLEARRLTPNEVMSDYLFISPGPDDFHRSSTMWSAIKREIDGVGPSIRKSEFGLPFLGGGVGGALVRATQHLPSLYLGSH